MGLDRCEPPECRSTAPTAWASASGHRFHTECHKPGVSKQQTREPPAPDSRGVRSVWGRASAGPAPTGAGGSVLTAAWLPGVLAVLVSWAWRGVIAVLPLVSAVFPACVRLFLGGPASCGQRDLTAANPSTQTPFQMRLMCGGPGVRAPGPSFGTRSDPQCLSCGRHTYGAPSSSAVGVFLAAVPRKGSGGSEWSATAGAPLGLALPSACGQRSRGRPRSFRENCPFAHGVPW